MRDGRRTHGDHYLLYFSHRLIPCDKGKLTFARTFAMHVRASATAIGCGRAEERMRDVPFGSSPSPAHCLPRSRVQRFDLNN